MDDDPEFTQALETVLHDLRAEGALLPRVSVAAGYGLMLHGPDGSGHGVRWPESGSAADRLANLADQVQEWAVEALWLAGVSAVWPRCPQHPNSHPLLATVGVWVGAGGEGEVDAEAAIWTCPRSGAVVARVGELAGGEATGAA
jgi:hypothetical protein